MKVKQDEKYFWKLLLLKKFIVYEVINTKGDAHTKKIVDIRVPSNRTIQVNK